MASVHPPCGEKLTEEDQTDQSKPQQDNAASVQGFSDQFIHALRLIAIDKDDNAGHRAQQHKPEENPAHQWEKRSWRWRKPVRKRNQRRKRHMRTASYKGRRDFSRDETKTDNPPHHKLTGAMIEEWRRGDFIPLFKRMFKNIPKTSQMRLQVYARRAPACLECGPHANDPTSGFHNLFQILQRRSTTPQSLSRFDLTASLSRFLARAVRGTPRSQPHPRTRTERAARCDERRAQTIRSDEHLLHDEYLFARAILRWFLSVRICDGSRSDPIK